MPTYLFRTLYSTIFTHPFGAPATSRYMYIMGVLVLLNVFWMFKPLTGGWGRMKGGSGQVQRIDCPHESARTAHFFDLHGFVGVGRWRGTFVAYQRHRFSQHSMSGHSSSCKWHVIPRNQQPLPSNIHMHTYKENHTPTATHKYIYTLLYIWT